MAFNNMDIDSWKALFYQCLEQVDRDMVDAVDFIVREVDIIVREIEEEYENRDYATYDDGHGRNETPMNDDHNSNSNDSIETSVETVLPQVVVSVESSGSELTQDNLHVPETSVETELPQVVVSVESSGSELPQDNLHVPETSVETVLPQVVVSVESSGSELPQDNLHVPVESSENADTLRFETSDIDQKQKDSLNSNSQKLGGVGKEAEDINQELQIIKDQSNLHMDFEVILEEILKEIWQLEKSYTGCRFIMARSFFIHTSLRHENNGDDGSQDNLYEIHEQKQKYWLNIYQQLEGACMEIEDIIQELEIIRETSIMDMDIELLKEEILDPAHQRHENLSKLVQDIEKEVALEDQKNRRKAYSYLQELEESITEESDEENDSSTEENDPVTDEMYYSCDSYPWDTMSDISHYGSCSVDTIWDRFLAKSPDFCVDNKVASEKSTVESDGNEALETEYSVPPNSPEEIKHEDEMNSAWRSNPIIMSPSSSDSDADINTSMESDMEDIHLTDDEFEQTWEFINPRKVHSIPSQQQKGRSIKERFLSYFGRREMVADDQSA